jgi:hypothetical protein
MPESSINQACVDWAETKAAYRFFHNEDVEVQAILRAHQAKTFERVRQHRTVLAIQDTSYLVYTSHRQTTGLGQISVKKGKRVEKIHSQKEIIRVRLDLLGRLRYILFLRKESWWPTCVEHLER